MPSNLFWSLPSFASQPQTGWRQSWRDAWRDAWKEVWSSPEIDVDGRGTASVRLLPDPDSALDLNDLSQRVIAHVGLAFEARIAAGPGVLAVCRDRETADLLRLAIGAGCRSIISFGVGGGLAPDLIPGDCVVASAIIDYPAVRPTDPLWSRKLAEMIPDARHGPIMGVNAVVSDPADKRKLHAFTRAVAVDMESHLVARLAAAHGLALAAVRVIIDPAHRAVPPAALLAMAPGGSADVSAMLREILARPSQVSPLMRLAADAISARAALVRLRRALGPSFSWE
ncbi:MAG: adenosylhopane nucleosidase [Xanthobacteraceae bacterium]